MACGSNEREEGVVEDREGVVVDVGVIDVSYWTGKFEVL
jgi:hypothetical protein